MINLDKSAGGVPEKQVVSDIECWLKLNGWKFHRIEQRIGFRAGTPDMIAGKEGRAIWIEAKRRAGPWKDKYGKIKNLSGNIQRPGQVKFQREWQGYLPYVVARKWEDVAEVIAKLDEIKTGTFTDVYGR